MYRAVPRRARERDLSAAHFIIGAVGSAGDTLPLVALARDLVEAGHEVDVLAADAFEPHVRAAGLPFHLLGKPGIYEVMAHDPTVWHWDSGFRSLWKYLATAIPDTVQQVDRLRRANTVLVSSTSAIGMRLAQEKFALPLVTVHMSPFYLFSSHETILGGLHRWPRWVPMWARSAILAILEKHIMDSACRGDINRMRQTMGLSPTSRIFTRWIHSPHRVICAVPTWFAPPQPDWPQQVASVSFPLAAAAIGAATSAQWVPDAKLAAFLAASDEKPIVFAAGTGAGAALTFYARAVAAATCSGRRTILITRWPEQIPAPLPDHICHIAYAPFDQFLPRVAAIVHNGGIGTMALAMQAGIPQVIVPFAYDQFYNAARLVALGGGVVIRRQREPEALAATIESVLQSDPIRQACARNRQSMQGATQGVAEMRDLVVALIPTR